MFGDAAKRKSVLDWVDTTYLRTVAILFFLLGLNAWAHILGITGGGLLQTYTTMQVFFLILAVFAPIVFFGLWAQGKWAIVLWGVGSLGVIGLNEIAFLQIKLDVYLALFGLFLVYITLRFTRSRLA